MASGLAFLHQEHIVHRDIKSLNVLLDQSYRAKLTDFGLSKVKTETKSQSMATQTSKDAVGTIAWMAPELFERRAIYTQKSDIYSLGITFWELASRKIPFADASNPSLIPSWVSKGDREEIPKDCPQKLASLIAACWEGSPDKRPDADNVVTYLKSDVNDFAQFLPVFASHHNPNKRSAPAMLIQCSPIAKPAPKVSDSEQALFLRLVVEGEQDKAEAMLKIFPELALVSEDVTDLSKRTFKNITAFQYAVWALDWHMWTMIRKYLPIKEAKLQAEGFEAGSWVRQHGVNAQHLLEKLIKAYQTTIDLYHGGWPKEEAEKAWVQKVGGAQLLLPAHVINEYCHPWRPFYRANFKEAFTLPRTRTVTADSDDDDGEWFTTSYNDGKLGEKFAYYGKGQIGMATACSDDDYCQIGYDPAVQDHRSIQTLTSTRTAQREELIAELGPKSTKGMWLSN